MALRHESSRRRTPEQQSHSESTRRVLVVGIDFGTTYSGIAIAPSAGEQ